MSTIKYSLVSAIKFWRSFQEILFIILFVPKKNVRCWEVYAINNVCYTEVSLYLEPFHKYIQMYAQNLVIFTKIGKPCVTVTIHTPVIWTILRHIQDSDIFKTLSITVSSNIFSSLAIHLEPGVTLEYL